ncbi:MAG: DUF748 domain-containing protein [Ignavibacteria bacterium]
MIINKAKYIAASRTGQILIALILILAAVRIALPYIVKDYVNKTLSEIPEYSGRVGDVDISLIRGAYVIEDVSLVKTDGKVPVPFFSAKRVDLSVQWSALFEGSVVGEIELDNPKINFVAGPSSKTSQKSVDDSWTDKVKELFPLRINRFEIHNGEIHYRDFHRDPQVNIFLRNLNATAENLTNSKDISKTLMATINATGNAMGSGTFRLHADINPFEKAPTFNLDAELKNIDLTKLNNFIKAYSKFDVEKGTFELFTELAASKGKFEGYIKPIFRNMQVLSLEKDSSNPLQLFWEAIVGAVTGLFENKSTDQLAARIPLSGNFEDPDANIWSTIGSVLENAFIKALLPSIEGSVDLKKVNEDNN